MTRLTQTVAAVCAGISICVTIFMLVRAFRYLRAQGLSFRKLVLSSRRSGSVSVWIRILVRLAVFELYCIIVVMIVVIMAARRPPAIIRQVIDFIVDTVPLVTFLVFGTSGDILRAWGLRRDSPQLSTTTISSVTVTRKSTFHRDAPPVPPKNEGYVMSPYTAGSDWPPSPPVPDRYSPIPQISRARRLGPADLDLEGTSPTLAINATPSLYREQTRRDPNLDGTSPTLAINATPSLYREQTRRDPNLSSVPPSAAPSMRSFASTEHLNAPTPPPIPEARWNREWGEPVRRMPTWDYDQPPEYPPTRR
ncbi:hypothetical protein EXIGLDRAFT_145908 [Exidia glandulosa HHB12029]|uniref:Uncharacterized protein n=1 Tax=Exidia glandulosa HHB12029 TaxID=1314781 RepID=A0A166A8E7_EXIGL|nr:hypothetical protein EXIGLDRAFT_145908 [Exidia glandulosa HHB12029]